MPHNTCFTSESVLRHPDRRDPDFGRAWTPSEQGSAAVWLRDPVTTANGRRARDTTSRTGHSDIIAARSAQSGTLTPFRLDARAAHPHEHSTGSAGDIAIGVERWGGGTGKEFGTPATKPLADAVAHRAGPRLAEAARCRAEVGGRRCCGRGKTGERHYEGDRPGSGKCLSLANTDR